MNNYEFVQKNEYQPLRDEAEIIIRKVQKMLKKEFTFQYNLVGSGKRHLVTRIKGGNRGFDLDFNLFLNNMVKAKFAKESLLAAFQEAIKGTHFNKVENSTSAITVKKVDKNNSRIVYSCDFAIMYYDNEKDLIKYVRFNKNQNNYTWENRKYSYKAEYKKGIVLNIYDWNQIKEKYLHLKNANKDLNKHSFQLFLETINNLYNEIVDEEDDYE